MVPSTLTECEKNQISYINGSNCDSRAISMVQLFQWKKKWIYLLTGAVCLVSNRIENLNFIRVIDLNNKTIIFQQELYDDFKFTKLKDFLYSFEGDSSIFSLSFSDLYEASIFYTTVLNYKLYSLATKNNSTLKSPKKQKRKSLSNLSIEISSSEPNSPINYSPPTTLKMSNTTEKKSKGRFFKKLLHHHEDKKVPEISGPTGFKHESHIGWDKENGFDIRNIPDDWKKLFQSAGIKKKDLNDPETAKFIFDVIGKNLEQQEKMGGKPISKPQQSQEFIQPQRSRVPPPPPPSSSKGMPVPTRSRVPPPPPPSKQQTQNIPKQQFQQPSSLLDEPLQPTKLYQEPLQPQPKPQQQQQSTFVYQPQQPPQQYVYQGGMVQQPTQQYQQQQVYQQQSRQTPPIPRDSPQRQRQAPPLPGQSRVSPPNARQQPGNLPRTSPQAPRQQPQSRPTPPIPRVSPTIQNIPPTQESVDLQQAKSNKPSFGLLHDILQQPQPQQQPPKIESPKQGIHSSPVRASPPIPPRPPVQKAPVTDYNSNLPPPPPPVVNSIENSRSPAPPTNLPLPPPPPPPVTMNQRNDTTKVGEDFGGSNTVASSSEPGGRADLLASIRNFKSDGQLKKVDSSEPLPPMKGRSSGSNSGGLPDLSQLGDVGNRSLLETLTAAMKNRRGDMREDDDRGDSDDSDWEM
ncbi:WASP-related protein [Tieghemostelium lacteum]|uniref:WASP-related protein n=1 Tax=Tieghemostelium lacteum TaxID=361077 RepID=A0A152A4R7_TIELA|nr:WASP-related protein [Tieghemostelium lacteum]|eukprot:KYR01214.1 WASP-related protein [Tieghemostelium lacteum]